MYTHKVTLVRPNTSAPFYYDSLLTTQEYLDFKQNYISKELWVSENVSVSEDGLTFTRIVEFISKAAYDKVMTEWSASHSFYVKQFNEYAITNNHTVTFEAFES
jgi:hypothetical protein